MTFILPWEPVARKENVAISTIDSLVPLSDGNVYIAICTGSEDAPNVEAYLSVRRGGFYPNVGWELKDCTIKGLPQKFRFEVLRSVKRVVNKFGQDAFVFMI